MILSPKNIPSPDTFKSLLQNNPLRNDRYLTVIRPSEYSIDDYERFASDREYGYWHNSFNNKIYKIKYSYAYLLFYYNLGIPDEEWFISPGKNGSSIEYFPHFNEVHYENKYLFCYYYENLYSYFFSAYDLVFHLLNSLLNLEVDHLKVKLRFEQKVLEKIKENHTSLNTLIIHFRNENCFKTAKNIRNDLVHNFPPYEVGHGMKRFKDETRKGVTVGIGQYTPSRIIVENINNILEKFNSFLTRIEEELNKI